MKKFKIEIKWALILIIMSLLWVVLERLVGLHDTHIDKQMYLTNLFIIPYALVFILALLDKKKKYYDGQMTYKQGLISGLIISIIVMIFVPLTQVITSNVITPDYFANVIEYSLETGYHTSLEEAEAYYSLKNDIINETVGLLVVNIVMTAIFMIFVRSKKK